MSPREARWYRWLLRLYPSAFRAAYGDEMRVLLTDQLRDARPRGRGAVLGVWLSTAVDAVLTAPGQHLRKEATMPQPVEPASVPTGRTRGDRLWLAMAAVPLILYVLLMVAAPGFMDPFFANPPSIAGLPAGMVMLGVALGLTALGILVVATVRADALRFLALLFVTLPAIALITLGPAVILIVQNLAI